MLRVFVLYNLAFGLLSIPAATVFATEDTLPHASLAEIRGYVYERQQDKAIALLERWLEQHPDDIDAFIKLNRLRIDIEAYDQVVESSQRYLKENPNCWECYFLKWDAMRERSMRNTTVIATIQKEMEALEQQKPGSRKNEFLISLHRAWYALGNQQRTAALLNKMLAGDKELASHPYLADVIFTRILRSQPTITIEEYLKHFSNERYANVLLRIALFRKLRDVREGKIAKESLLEWTDYWRELHPESFEPDLYAAKMLRLMRERPEQQREYLKRSLRVFRRHSWKNRDRIISDKFWRQQIARDRAQLKKYLAWTEHLLGNSRRAHHQLRLLDNALRTEPEFLFNRGVVARSLGRQEAARYHLYRALERGFDPNQVIQELNSIDKPTIHTVASLREAAAKRRRFPQFTDITESVGAAEVKGLWLSWADFDRDGDDDLMVTGGERGYLLENQQLPDGNIVFTEVWKNYLPTTVKKPAVAMWADIDRNGYLDLFLSRESTVDEPYPNAYLLMNKGGNKPKFTDKSDQLFSSRRKTVIAAAAWGDVNGDLWPDLYIANFELPGGVPTGRCMQDQLWVNKKGEKFIESSKPFGCRSLEPMCGRGVSFADYDVDGDQDIYVSNYRLDPNFLWKNDRNRKFVDKAKESGVRGNQVLGYFGHSIGPAFGDLDNDGDLDLLTSNLAHPRDFDISDITKIYRYNHRTDKFEDYTASSGIHYKETHSDPSLGDLDNDGDLDLILTAVYPGRKLEVYSNRGDGTFDEVSFATGMDATNTWGSALADFDNDGDLDVAVASKQGIRIYRNEGTTNNWLHVRPVLQPSGSEVIGSRVEVTTGDSITRVREIRAGKGTGNQDSLMAEFGLGSWQGPVTINVRYPNGESLTLQSPTTNKKMTVQPTQP